MIQIRTAQIGYKKALVEIEALDIQDKRIFGLIGSNGSGKSTLLKTLSGQIPPLSGEIFIQGRQLSSYAPTERAKTIAFVRPITHTIEHQTIEDHIALGRTPYTNALGRLSKEDHIVINEVIEILNIEFLRTKMLTEVSDGERQLATIARALAQDTPIILLDEPSSFLDYSNREKLLKTLIDLREEHDKTILFSSHDVDNLILHSLPMLGIRNDNQRLELVPKTMSKQDIKSIYFH